jgi:hypothetical protein
VRRSNRNLIAGAAAAAAGAATLIIPAIGTVPTWKVVLGILGVALFVAAGRGSRSEG